MPPQKSIWIIVLLLAINLMKAQQVMFKTYTTQDGLVANQVRKVTQDAEGFIWIATWEGLSKYDGHRFTNFNTTNGLSFDLVNDLYVDDENRIYVAENDGHIDIITHSQLSTPLTDSVTINKFIKSDSTVYAVTDYHGIAFLRNGNLHLTSQNESSILDLAVVNDSLFLILDSDFQAILQDSRFQPFSKDSSGKSYRSITVDSRNNIWLYGPKSLSLLNPVQERNKPIQFLPLPDLFRHSIFEGANIYDLYEDDDGNYWVSTVEGLIRVFPDGRVQIFTTKNGLPINLVKDLFQDVEKNIWAGSELGVVKVTMKNDFQVLILDHELTNQSVYNLTAGPSNHIYFNNIHQIFKMNCVNFQVESYGPPDQYNFILKNPVTDGLFAISNGKLKELGKRNHSAVPIESVPGINFIQAEVDARNNIFIGSYNGIYVKSSSGALEHFALDHRVTAMEFDGQACIWAGTWDSGLFRIKIHYLANRIVGEVEDLTPIIQSLNVRSLYKDRSGNLWIGTRYDGILKLSQDTNKQWTMLQCNKRAGLSSNWVSCITEDNVGNIWVGTHSGLNKLISEKDSLRIFNFSRLNNHFGEVHSIYAAPDGFLWGDGVSGLIRFHDDQVDTISVPSAIITSVTAGNDKLDLLTLETRLKYNSGHITFEFSSPTFLNENGIMYSHRLLGPTNVEWSIPRNQHTISYSGLAPGNYSFEVRPYGLNNLSGEITKFPFFIIPPFWKTWWFFLSVGLLFLLLMLVVHQYRVQQLIQWQEARDRIATDLHDEIGSSLTNIGILSELSYKHLYQPEGVEKYLQRISEEVQSSAQAIDDIIWSVNSHNDTLENTLARMRRFTAELFDSSETTYHLQLDEEIKIHKLNMDQRRDLFLMYKEILNNIYKHAHANEVWINVHLVNHMIRLNIRDNGKGFLVNSASHRNGLKNIYHRTSKWKGDISVDSKEGKGTVIDIRIPMKV